VAADPRRCPRRDDLHARDDGGAAFGAALQAAVGAGWFGSVDEAVAALVRAEPVAEPGSDGSGYAEIHGRYRELYPALAPVFHAGK
jgi:xylulokinase